jgi:hypothetical protein
MPALIDLERFGITRADVDDHKAVGKRIAATRGDRSKVDFKAELARRADESDARYQPKIDALTAELSRLAAKLANVQRSQLEDRNVLVLAQTFVEAQPNNAADLAAASKVAFDKQTVVTNAAIASHWDPIIASGVVTADEVKALPMGHLTNVAIGLPAIIMGRNK